MVEEILRHVGEDDSSSLPDQRNGGERDEPVPGAHSKIIGVHVTDDREAGERLKERWARSGIGIPLVVLSSPYRSLLAPFLDYVDHHLALGEDHMVTIVIPEFIPRRWWQHLLHNQTALLIKGALLFHKRVVVVDVPFHLR